MALTDGLEAFWKFDGNVLDSQGSHHGTASAELVYRPGVNGLGAGPVDLNIDGSLASNAITPIELDAGDGWTIAMRCVPRENWDGVHMLFKEAATGKGLYLDDNSGNRGIGYYDGTSDWPATGALGWPAVHHVAARFNPDGGELTLFANGVPVLNEAIGAPAGEIAIDRVGFDGFSWSLLVADNAAIYTRPLSDEEIEELVEWAGPGSGSDATTPAVEIISPAEGTELNSNTALVVKVTDPLNLARVLIVARFPNGDEELVTVATVDGIRFTTRYSRSTFASVTGGAQFSIVRNAGWLQAPTLDVYAVDAAGNWEA